MAYSLVGRDFDFSLRRVIAMDLLSEFRKPFQSLISKRGSEFSVITWMLVLMGNWSFAAIPLSYCGKNFFE